MVDALKDKGLGELLMILFEISLVKVAIQAISIVIMLVVYGRMFEIYVYSSVSAIPFATMGNKEWGADRNKLHQRTVRFRASGIDSNGLSWNLCSIG